MVLELRYGYVAAEWAFPGGWPYSPESAWHVLLSSPCRWSHFLLDRRNHLKVEREHSHRFGCYQRNDNDMDLLRLPKSDGTTTVSE